MPFIPLTTSLSSLILHNKHTGIFSESDFEIIEVPIEKIEAAEDDVRKRLNVKMTTGKYSEVLIQQLARHSLSMYEKFGNEIHCYHMQTILNIIEAIEHGKTVNIRNFNKPLLLGLKHAHHNSNTFVVQNIHNTWREKIKGNDEINYQNNLLKEIYFKLLIDYSEQEASDRMLSVLLTKLMYESKFKNSTKQTGEWIVFQEKNNIKYYLCLATHHEAKEFSDQVIVDRIKTCYKEFPELLT